MPKVVLTAAKGLHQVAGSASIEGHRRAIKNAPASTTTALSNDDSGKLILVAPNAAAITLPAPTAGVFYDFIFTGDGATASCTITADAATSYFIGGYIAGDNSSAGVFSDANSNDVITAVFNGGAKAGDRISICSDGSNWFITGGMAQVAAGLTISDG